MTLIIIKQASSIGCRSGHYNMAEYKNLFHRGLPPNRTGNCVGGTPLLPRPPIPRYVTPVKVIFRVGGQRHAWKNKRLRKRSQAKSV
eukprot:3729553-Pyramimonas_sp.AAC.2